MHKILIITGDATDAKTLEDALGRAGDGSFAILSASNLAEGIKQLQAGGIDAVMVDLSLSDSRGIETFDRLFAVAPHTPIMALFAVENEMLTTEAVQCGAQGYLSKAHFGSYLVPQSLRNMIQRKVVEEKFFIEKNRAETTLNSISNAVIGTDMAGNVDYLNIAAEIMTGWPREDARGHPVSEVMRIINGTTRKPKRNPIDLVLRQDKPMQLTAGTILIRRDGREVAIAEDCGLIVPIGQWVLREACAQTKRCEVAGLQPISMAVNISALELRRRGFVEGVRAILLETGLSPSCLQLEITESVLMDDAEASAAILQQLKDIGVRLAVDDFGTGYSSLSYLIQFPIDVLKIDRSLVHDIDSINGKGIVVGAVIAMGASLNQQVVAEGVEDQGQLDFLKAHHCEEGQGFFFSRPLAAEQFSTLLATGIDNSLPSP